MPWYISLTIRIFEYSFFFLVPLHVLLSWTAFYMFDFMSFFHFIFITSAPNKATLCSPPSLPSSSNVISTLNLKPPPTHIPKIIAHTLQDTGLQPQIHPRLSCLSAKPHFRNYFKLGHTLTIQQAIWSEAINHNSIAILSDPICSFFGVTNSRKEDINEFLKTNQRLYHETFVRPRRYTHHLGRTGSLKFEPG